MNKVTDVVKEGDKVKVKLLGMDERGKVRLSMKVVDQATGEDLEAKQKAGEPQQQPAARPSNAPHQRNKRAAPAAALFICAFGSRSALAGSTRPAPLARQCD